jgi:hypothetical protein
MESILVRPPAAQQQPTDTSPVKRRMVLVLFLNFGSKKESYHGYFNKLKR